MSGVRRALDTSKSPNLRLYDKDKDGTVGISELYRALREIVWRETGGQQTPWLARQDLIGDFALF